MTQKNDQHEAGRKVSFQHHHNTITPDPVYDRARLALKEVPQGRCRRIVAYMLAHGPSTTAELAGRRTASNTTSLAAIITRP